MVLDIILTIAQGGVALLYKVASFSSTCAPTSNGLHLSATDHIMGFLEVDPNYVVPRVKIAILPLVGTCISL